MERVITELENYYSYTCLALRKQEDKLLWDAIKEGKYELNLEFNSDGGGTRRFDKRQKHRVAHFVVEPGETVPYRNCFANVELQQVFLQQGTGIVLRDTALDSIRRTSLRATRTPISYLTLTNAVTRMLSSFCSYRPSPNLKTPLLLEYDFEHIKENSGISSGASIELFGTIIDANWECVSMMIKAAGILTSCNISLTVQNSCAFPAYFVENHLVSETCQSCGRHVNIREGVSWICLCCPFYRILYCGRCGDHPSRNIHNQQHVLALKNSSAKPELMFWGIGNIRQLPLDPYG